MFAIVVTEQHDIFFLGGRHCLCNAVFQKDLGLDTQEMGSCHQLINNSARWTGLPT